MVEDYFKEVKQIIKELAESQKKTDEEHKKIKEEMRLLIAQNRKTSAEIRKFTQSTKKTEEAIRKISEENQRRSEKTDEEIRKTEEEIRKTEEEIRKTEEEIRKTEEAIRKMSEENQRRSEKTDEEIRKVNKLVAGVSDGFGRMTEGFVLASIEKIFENMGIHINKTLSRVISRKNGHHLEIDLLNLAKSDKKELVIVVEVKTYLRTDDVKDFLNDISNFYDFFEEYRDKEIIGVIAFMNYAQGAKEYAEKNGFYLLFCSEDLMKMVNKKGFTPQLWKYDEV